MNIGRIGIASLLSVVVLNVWAGGGGAAPKSNAKASYDVTGTWVAKIEGRARPGSNHGVCAEAGWRDDHGHRCDEWRRAGRNQRRQGRAFGSALSVKTTLPPMQMPGQPPNPNAKPTQMVTKYTAKVSDNDMN